jgi:SPW repeat
LLSEPAVFGAQGGLLTAAPCRRRRRDLDGGGASAGRFINVLFGAWLVAAPWPLGAASARAKWNDVVAGAVLAFISLPRGNVRERCGRRDRRIV